jgi:hypothetical protein
MGPAAMRLVTNSLSNNTASRRIVMKSFSSFSQATIWHATLLGSILLVAPNLRAQTEVQADWINSSPFGRYSIATNWSTGTVPNNDSSFVYCVAINQGTVISDQNATINSLTIGSNGTLWDHGPGVSSPGSITAGTMVNEGSVAYVIGGALNVSGDFINSGNFSMAAGSARATVGNTYNSGYLTSSAFGGSITVNGTLKNEGNVLTGFRLTVNGDLTNTGSVGTDINGINQISGDVSNFGAYALGTRDVISGIVDNHGIMSTPRRFDSHVRIGSLDNDGVLHIGNRLQAGEISNGGTISLGGMVNAGVFDQHNDGIWQEESGALGFGTVAVTDFIYLDGTLDLSPLAKVQFVPGQSFDLATFPPGNLIGSFSAILGNTFSNGQLMFQISYDQNAGRIRLTVVPAAS